MSTLFLTRATSSFCKGRADLGKLVISPNQVGDYTLMVHAKSKSTLLKCVSHLNIYEGEVLYRGQCVQIAT